MTDIISSAAQPEIGWSDVSQFAGEYGVKAAASLSIPRAWTPPFLAISSRLAKEVAAHDREAVSRVSAELEALFHSVGANALPDLIVRSSVVDETIWDRGTYESIVLLAGPTSDEREAAIVGAAAAVVGSAAGRPTGLLIQQYIQPAACGEFGNLLRISKTRDHWEISTSERGTHTHKQRMNSQRDSAADPRRHLAARPGLPRERLFGSIGAWLNNELLLGRRERLTCEWVTDNRRFFLVQIDQEDEDTTGINPQQIRVEPSVQPSRANGTYLKIADVDALGQWDKLKVLQDLWEPEAAHKPTLFYVALSDLPDPVDQSAIEALASDFADLIGHAGIVVRTSVRAGAEKLPNLFRTDCLTPDAAARWCFDKKLNLKQAGAPADFAFVAHRFVAARASAWAKADPNNPSVEIHALWGLPDALQYCPFDIWEVHVPTGSATDYPEYKSDMLMPRPDGGWAYARIKNDVARANCLLTREARDLAERSHQIAKRLGRACHIMWFVGCVDEAGNSFNIPWYWTEAHETEPNPDRSAFRVTTIGNTGDLKLLTQQEEVLPRQAIEFRPTDLNLMRDTKFIESVGQAALDKEAPIILAGSTLAHAYYQLRKMGCNVITPSEKRHARKRRSANFGKLVRDKIPDKIAQRQEARSTKQIDGTIRKSFLVTKLLEEALEVRAAISEAEKLEELADVFEVLRALAKIDGISLQELEIAADEKVEKAGGFEQGLVLLETAITGALGDNSLSDASLASVLGDTSTDDVAELPFSFFGFMQMDQTKGIYFERFGIRLELTLRPDRLDFRLIQSSEQLDFDL